jgi:hypothetical protein
LAARLPVLRAALEQQCRFRHEQLAQLDENRRTHECVPAPANSTDPQKRETVLALREVDALVAAGARCSLADIELPWPGCGRDATATADHARTPSPRRARGHAAGARHIPAADIPAEVVATTELDTGGRVE